MLYPDAGHAFLLGTRRGETAAEPTGARLRIEAADCQRALRLLWRREAHLSLTAIRLRDLASEHFRDGITA